MKNEVRYKTIPTVWPADSTVYIDFANGITKEYQTDAKGVPSFIRQYINETSGGGSWGSITGTLGDQTDLQSALNVKQATLVSGTNIKTVNSLTLLGSGNVALDSSNVPDTLDKRYVTDADLVDIATIQNKLTQVQILKRISLGF